MMACVFYRNYWSCIGGNRAKPIPKAKQLDNYRGTDTLIQIGNIAKALARILNRRAVIAVLLWIPRMKETRAREMIGPHILGLMLADGRTIRY